MAKFCSECGDELVAGSKFCGGCGAALTKAESSPSSEDTTATQPVATQPGPAADAAVATAPVETTTKDRKKVGWIAAGVVVAALLIGGGLAFALGSGGDEVATPKAPPSTTSTTVDPAKVQQVKDVGAFVDKLENILNQSASGRGQVGRLVTGVQNGCQIAPYDASQQIRTVIDNRTSILNQLAGVGTAPSPETQNASSLLQQALQSSIEADIQYKGWMDFLYTDYYYTYPVGCPNGGAPPTNSAFDAARTADGNSTRLKQQFVDAFNGIASFYGAPTWSGSDF